MGYYRGDRPKSSYLCIYWARGPIRGRVNPSIRIHVSKWRSEIWLNSSRRVVPERIPPRLSKSEVKGCGLPLRVTFWIIPWVRISIRNEQDRGKSWNISRESCYHRIKCSAANSLAALIRKWYLNSNFQPYSYYLKTLGRCWWDKDQHLQSDLHVEGGDEMER